VGGSAQPEFLVRRVFSVGELVSELKSLLEDEFGRVWVVGEISNLRRARSGHSYFTLKDDEAQIRAALFRGVAQRLAFDPEDGLEVVVFGDLTLYPSRGDLQIIVRSLEPRGQGALQLAFEQLRARLEAEGLFAPELKRPLPEFPRRVGVVTSPSGAAIRDVIQVTGQCFPSIPLLVAPTRVQGEGAEEEIAAALELVAGREVDVILLVRGGGSLEDLFAFNTERVARAIRDSPVPVVSGVGHEVDVTISDLVADARAPTPSAAAALALPDRQAQETRLDRDRRRLRLAAVGTVDRAARRLGRGRESLRVHAPSALAHRVRAEAALGGLQRGIRANLAGSAARFAAVSARLDALSPLAVLPLAVLSRGYAIVYREPEGAIVRRAREVSEGDALRLRVAEGEIDATVSAVREPEK
jgi:exodeoxyribonuclease VII large subunit